MFERNGSKKFVYPFRPKIRKVVKTELSLRKRNETLQLTQWQSRNSRTVQQQIKVATLKKMHATRWKKNLNQSKERSRKVLTELVLCILMIVSLAAFAAVVVDIFGKKIPKATEIHRNQQAVPNSTSSSIVPTAIKIPKWQENYIAFHEETSISLHKYGQAPPDSKVMVYISSLRASDLSKASDIVSHHHTLVSLLVFCVAHKIAFYIDWPLAFEIYDFPHLQMYINSTNTTFTREEISEYTTLSTTELGSQSITFIRAHNQLDVYQFQKDFSQSQNSSLSYLLLTPVKFIMDSIRPLISNERNPVCIDLERKSVGAESDISLDTCAKVIMGLQSAQEVVLWLFYPHSPKYEQAIRYIKQSPSSELTKATFRPKNNDHSHDVQWEIANQYIHSLCGYSFGTESDCLLHPVQSPSDNSDRILIR